MTKITVKDIGSKTVTASKHTGPRAKYSTFHIIINTNQKPENDEHELKLRKKLRKIIKKVFTEENLPKVIKFLDGDSWDDGLIDSVDVKFSLERGESDMGGRVHSHTMATIKHHSKIHINIKGLRDVVTDLLGSNPYIKVMVVKTALPLEEYIAKEAY